MLTMAQKSTPWVGGEEGGRCVGLASVPNSCAECLQIWEPQPSGILRACPGLALVFTSVYINYQPIYSIFRQTQIVYIYIRML